MKRKSGRRSAEKKQKSRNEVNHTDVTSPKKKLDNSAVEDEQEELDFMFDEELEQLGDGGRKNQFTDHWYIHYI